MQGRGREKRFAVCGVSGAGENEGGARRGHRSRDQGAEELPGTDHSHPGKNYFNLISWRVHFIHTTP